MVSVSSHIDLKNRVSDFWHMRLLFFYKRIKFEKKKKEPPAKNSQTPFSRRTSCSPNFSHFGQAAADLELEIQVQIANFLLSRNRKTKIRRHPSVVRLSQISRDGG